MRIIYSFLLMLVTTLTNAQTNPTAQAMPYTQDFASLAASYPAGWQGWTISTVPSSTFNVAPATVDRVLVTGATAATNSGNINNYVGKLGFLNTGSLDLGLVLAIVTTGQSNIPVSYDVMTLRNPYDGTTNTRVNEITLQYRVGTTGNFTNITGVEYQNNTTTQITAITTGQNLVTKTLALPAACDNQAVVQLRWASRQVSGGGARPSFAIDNVIIGGGGADVTPPTATAFTPADDAINVFTGTTLEVTFSEGIQKGTGNILLKKLSDNSTVQTIDVTTATVSVSGNAATITINPLLMGTGYFVEIAAGAFKDLANNNYAGIAGNTTWNFTASAAIFDVNFNTCTATLAGGLTQYSVTGTQVWACTTFGHGTTPTGSAPNGVQINGFASGSNVINEDWLISPSLNLLGTTYPLLSFYSRTAFNGAPLKLRVSTNYTGIGNPSLATWTEISGSFPVLASDVWTLSQNINLTAYKTANTYVAFVYNSTADDGARWTLDDLKIDNSLVPPPTTLTTNTDEVNFGFVPVGNSLVKTFIFNANDITGAVTLTAPVNTFLISKTNGSFTNTLSYTLAEANNIPQTVYVQFSPTLPTATFSGNLTISTAAVADKNVVLKGNTIDAATTLDVVNWNIEWFGSTTLGPSNKPLQEQNIKTVLQNVGADVYALEEVVSETRLANIVSQMPGYAYVLSNYGSYTNPNQSGAGPLSEAQKLGFVYKTALFPAGVTSQALLSAGINTAADLTNPAYNWYASGRFPFMVTGTTTLNGVTKTLRFIITHAKANTSPTLTSYARRKAGNDSLRTHLNTFYPNDNIIFLGDFNDDLDSTITAGINPKLSSYKQFTDDATNFYSPTLALSLAGKKSTVSYNDVIDHVMLSNEMKCSYMAGTAAILTDVASTIPNYGNTTTDHYPVYTRYLFQPINSAAISYAASPYCQNSGNVNVNITGTTGGTYSSTTGLIINSTTGVINTATSTPGLYTVTYELAASGACNPIFTTTASVAIVAAPAATITYGTLPYCSNAGTAAVTRTGTTGGTYSSITGLTINASTGDVTLATSTAGTYTITYTVAATGGCAIFTTTAQIVITAAANATISYTNNPYCQAGVIVPVVRTGTPAGVYSSTAGLSINSNTGFVNIGTSIAGTYVVTYTVAANAGCALYTTTTNIGINDVSVAPTSATASNTVICANIGTVNLTATGGTLGAGATYKWYAGSCGGTLVGTGAVLNFVTVLATTTFYVRIEGACNNTTCASVTVTVAPKPTVQISTITSTAVTPSTPVTLIATVLPTGTYNYEWTKNTSNILTTNADRIIVTASEAGNYTVKVTAPSGCTATSASTLVTSATSASLFISANPNRGIFNVSFNNGGTNLDGRTINIYDAKGAKIFTQTYNNSVPYSNMKVDISRHAKGTYYVMLVDAIGKELVTGQVQIL
jgi:endonuclease/exonuclease/phosphatase family metal-dependent hydrolase